MDPVLASILIAALGGTSVLGVAIQEIHKFTSGRAARERRKNRHAIERALDAEDKSEWDRAARRLLEDYAARLRRQIITDGHEPAPWPKLEEKLGPRP